MTIINLILLLLNLVALFLNLQLHLQIRYRYGKPQKLNVKIGANAGPFQRSVTRTLARLGEGTDGQQGRQPGAEGMGGVQRR